MSRKIVLKIWGKWAALERWAFEIPDFAPNERAGTLNQHPSASALISPGTQFGVNSQGARRDIRLR